MLVAATPTFLLFVAGAVMAVACLLQARPFFRVSRTAADAKEEAVAAALSHAAPHSLQAPQVYGHTDSGRLPSQPPQLSQPPNFSKGAGGRAASGAAAQQAGGPEQISVVAAAVAAATAAVVSAPGPVAEGQEWGSGNGQDANGHHADEQQPPRAQAAVSPDMVGVSVQPQQLQLQLGGAASTPGGAVSSHSPEAASLSSPSTAYTVDEKGSTPWSGAGAGGDAPAAVSGEGPERAPSGGGGIGSCKVSASQVVPVAGGLPEKASAGAVTGAAGAAGAPPAVSVLSPTSIGAPTASGTPVAGDEGVWGLSWRDVHVYAVQGSLIKDAVLKRLEGGGGGSKHHPPQHPHSHPHGQLDKAHSWGHSSGGGKAAQHAQHAAKHAAQHAQHAADPEAGLPPPPQVGSEGGATRVEVHAHTYSTSPAGGRPSANGTEGAGAGAKLPHGPSMLRSPSVRIAGLDRRKLRGLAGVPPRCTPILVGVSGSCAAGQVMGLLGPSGSGK